MEELYKSRLEDQLHFEKKSTNKIINQGSEVITDVTLDEIDRVLKRMKNKKAPRKDGIVTDAVKLAGQPLMTKIKVLFNIHLHDKNGP